MSKERELLKICRIWIGNLKVPQNNTQAYFQIQSGGNLIEQIEAELANPDEPICASCKDIGSAYTIGKESTKQQNPLSDDEILQIINDIDEVEDLNFWEKEAIERGFKLAEKHYCAGQTK